MFSAFRMGLVTRLWLQADADYMISIEYNSELLNHVWKKREVLARRKYIENLGFSIWLIIGLNFEFCIMESLLGITLNTHFTQAFDNRINRVTIG